MRRSSPPRRTVLRRYRPDPDRQPHLVARIDDPRHADHWRGWHIGRSSRWFEDALSAHESTASGLLDQVFRDRAQATAAVRGQHPGPGHPPRAGPAGLGTPQELAEAAATGRHGHADPTTALGPTSSCCPLRCSTCCCSTAGPRTCAASTSRPPRRPMVRRAVRGAAPKPRPGRTGCSPCWTRCRPRPPPGPPWSWRMTLSERGMHEAGRVARLHPGDPRVRADLRGSRHERRDLRSAAPFPAGPAGGRRGPRGHLDQGGPPLARVLPPQPSARRPATRGR